MFSLKDVSCNQIRQRRQLWRGRTHLQLPKSYRKRDCDSASRSPTHGRKTCFISLGTLDPDYIEEDLFWSKVQVNTDSKSITTQHVAYKTMICRNLEWNYTLNKKECQYVSTFYLSATSTHHDRHQLSPFNSWSVYIEWKIKNDVICQQWFKLTYYHTVFNVICRLSLIYNYFKTKLYIFIYDTRSNFLINRINLFFGTNLSPCLLQRLFQVYGKMFIHATDCIVVENFILYNIMYII